MSTRVIKKKVFYVGVGSRTFRYTEIIEEILSTRQMETVDLTTNEPVAYIDLTRAEADSSSENNSNGYRIYSPYPREFSPSSPQRSYSPTYNP